MGKGSARRPTDEAKFQANYDKIFGKKEIDIREVEFGPIVVCQHPGKCANPFCNCEVKHENL